MTLYLACQLRNADRIVAVAPELGWQPQLPDAGLRCGILMLRAKDWRVRELHADALRDLFQQRGVTLTAYGDGLVRLAMPQVPLRFFEFDDLFEALAQCSHIREPAGREVSATFPTVAAAG